MSLGRQVNLDAMRFFGVLLIMIAHATPPQWLMQLRNFGTPLLIVASALTYAVIYQAKVLQYFPFIKKRLSRLIIPAWLFLTFFFSVTYVWFKASGGDYPFSVKNIISSYSFYYGIGFVWIFKVYIILALLTPIALKIRALPISNQVYFSGLFVIYCLYELLLNLLQAAVPTNLKDFMDRVVFILVPYTLLYLYGMRLSSLSNRVIAAIAAVSIIVFTWFALHKINQFGSFVPTEKFKYPPNLYYLSYAFFWVNIVYLIVRNMSAPSGIARDVILWLSTNSLWIYLWHIMAVFMWNFTLGEKVDGFTFFMLKFVFIFLFGCACTYIQTNLVHRYLSSSNRIAGVLT